MAMFVKKSRSTQQHKGWKCKCSLISRLFPLSAAFCTWQNGSNSLLSESLLISWWSIRVSANQDLCMLCMYVHLAACLHAIHLRDVTTFLTLIRFGTIYAISFHKKWIKSKIEKNKFFKSQNQRDFWGISFFSAGLSF